MDLAPPARRFALLVNPAAGRGRALDAAPVVADELGGLGAHHRLVVSRDLEEAIEAARSAAAEGETVVAIGGDGFAGPVAGALRGSPSALAVVPSGRGNDFARALGVPKDPRAAARLAVAGEERLVDVGLVDGRPFLGIASVGFDSDVQEIANRVRRGGSLVYLYAALRALRRWRHATFEARVDGKALRVTGYAAAVANSGVYGGGMRLVPHARLDDGRLDVLLIGAHPKTRYLASLPKVFKGAHLDGNASATLAEGVTVELRADRPFAVYADGDPIGELPVTVTVEPRALRVIAPAVATTTGRPSGAGHG